MIPAFGGLRARDAAPPLAALLVLTSGLVLRTGPLAIWASPVWMAGLVLLGLPVVWRTVRGALVGQFAADLVASLSIITAIALIQPVPGLVVVLMQTGGEALERYAAGRASRAVQELEAAAPRRATRLGPHGGEEIAVELVEPGDRLLVRPGEMVPCDGEVVEGHSHVDASRLTGEPVPVTAEPGVTLPSGSLNIESPFTLQATAPARESQYAKIVQLVRNAQASKSRLQRLADRTAVWFTPLTLTVCLVAWLASRDPLRVLAVLVVATPCPLILAAPVAMIGGINRAARRSVIIRHGEALERLSRATAVLLDKTGTLTVGRPVVDQISPCPPFSAGEVLRLAAAVDAGSGHLLARSIVEAAMERGLAIPPATGVVERPGEGVLGQVEGREITLGARSFVVGRHPALAARWTPDGNGGLRAWLAVGDQAAGTIGFADRLHPEANRLVSGLRGLGLGRIVMVTGDQSSHAEAVSRSAGIGEYRAELLPADKVRAVEELERAGEHVLMVGDGTNDAPALSRASVGVALAAHGGGITAEAADAVVLVDDPSRVAEAIAIGRRTVRIARQSVWAGVGLSGLGMIAAALGHIPPTVGALLQEGIDVAVILNALRASGEPRG